MKKLVYSVEQWATEKGLNHSDPAKQFLKLVEEVGEVSEAYTRGSKSDLQMAIGDLFVTAIVFAMQNGLDATECLKSAYGKIAKRKGETINGVFVKAEDLKDKSE